MYSTALWCVFVVLLCFWLYCVTTVTPFIERTLRSMKGVTVVTQKSQENSKTTNTHQNAVEYIAGKSFLFNSFKKK